MLKKLTKHFCQVFSKQVDEVRVDEMVGLKRLFARCIALITLKPKDLNQTLVCTLIAFRKAVVLCSLYSVLLNARKLYSVLCALYS